MAVSVDLSERLRTSCGRFRSEPPASETGEFADFILWPDGPRSGDGARARWAEVHGWLERLKIGGVAVVGLQYKADDAHDGGLSRNETRQWALRLIGMGYSLAPLAFASRNDLAVDDAGMVSGCLVVRRQ